MEPKDFSDYYNSRYEHLKEILLKKTKAVSINNAKKSFNDVSVIGMVKELTDSGFVLEDPTGEIEVQSKSDVSEDDVIAATGFVRNNPSQVSPLEWVFSSAIVTPALTAWWIQLRLSTMRTDCPM